MADYSYAQMIRDHSRKTFVEPARKAGRVSFEIQAGEVHSSLRLTSQMPNVCQALRGRQFLKENNLLLDRVDGPQSGQGSRVRFFYRFSDAASEPGIASDSDRKSPIWGLRGIAREVFRELGGAENFLKAQRETFDRGSVRG